MGKSYTSTIDVRCLKEHTCLCCGAVYAYELKRKVTGSAPTKEKAVVRAQAAAAKTVEREVDMEPCPTCGLLQPDMIGQRRAKRHKTLFWLALIAFIVIVILRAAYAIQSDTAVWTALIACAVVAALHLLIDLPDPNRNPDGNRQMAEQRVASGALRHTPGQFLPGSTQLARTPRSMGHWLALVLLLVAVALASQPEAMRRARGWPLNVECYPPVVGPGDETRIYMTQKIDSVKGYWRGNPTAVVSTAGGGKPLNANAETNQNDWGSSISVKSSEKHSTSTPWVRVTMPNEASLAGKTAACDIDLKIAYPEMEGSSSFHELNTKMHRSINIQMAPPEAGASYNGWWWTGTVLAMGIISCCGVYLIIAARSLQKKAKPTRSFLPDGTGRV
jgi:hypothetical protein